MMVHAFRSDHRINLATTLACVTRLELKPLENVRFSQIMLHVPDEEGNSKFNITEAYLDALRYFVDFFNITLFSCHGTVHHAVRHVVDECAAPLVSSDSLHNRAGNLAESSLRRASRKGRVQCVLNEADCLEKWASAGPVVLPDGRVTLCCMDYGMKHVLGNLLVQTWREIKNGDECRKIESGLKDDSMDILCRSCVCAYPAERLPSQRFLNAVNNNGMTGGGITVRVQNRCHGDRRAVPGSVFSLLVE